MPEKKFREIWLQNDKYQQHRFRVQTLWKVIEKHGPSERHHLHQVRHDRQQSKVQKYFLEDDPKGYEWYRWQDIEQIIFVQ